MKYTENSPDVVAALNAISKGRMTEDEVKDFVDTLKHMMLINKVE